MQTLTTMNIDSLRLGFDVIPFPNYHHGMKAMIDVKSFFSNDLMYKKTFSHAQKIEIGYYDLRNKETFCVRNQCLPRELLSCIDYFDAVSRLAFEYLSSLANALGWDIQQLLAVTKHHRLPLESNSSSLLRLLNYHPSEQDQDACDIHEDLGLLSIIIKTDMPALEVYHFRDSEWFAIEQAAKPTEAIILVGETLSALSNHYLLPATHRVRASISERVSMVYQLRADADAILNSDNFISAVTGQFAKPFCMTGAEFYQDQIRHRQSVNGSY